jgi:hypothetical protein
MPEPKIYTTAGAFRKALEERLRTAALKERVDLNRLRRQVSFVGPSGCTDSVMQRNFDPRRRQVEGW